MTRVLIVGAGITGAVTASLLKFRLPQNSHIAVWEMCKQAGGRMKTIFHENDHSQFANLGAQYISPSVEEYTDHSCFYEDLEKSGLLQPLLCRVEGLDKRSADRKHFIATKGMSCLVEHYLTKSGAETCYETTLSDLSLQTGKFIATTSSCQSSQFDCVVLTMPVPQLFQLRGDIVQILASQPEVEKQLRAVEYSTRYTVGLFLDAGQWQNVDWGMKFFDDPVIRFIAINGGLPVTETVPKIKYSVSSRTLSLYSLSDTGHSVDEKTHSMVVHTTVQFGLENINCDVNNICNNVVLSRLRQLLPRLPAALFVKPLRWQYSQVSEGYSGAPAAVVIHRSPTLIGGGDAFTSSTFDGCLTSAVKIVSSVCEQLLPPNLSGPDVATEPLT